MLVFKRVIHEDDGSPARNLKKNNIKFMFSPNSLLEENSHEGLDNPDRSIDREENKVVDRVGNKVHFTQQD